jgi:proteasome beta subunit
LHAGTVIKVGFRHDLNREQAIDLAATSLWEAADADSATGGPDVLRGIYPVIASIDSDGWERIEDADLARRYERIIQEVAER